MQTEREDGDFAAPASQATKPKSQRWLILALLACTLFVRGRILEQSQDNLARDPDGYREIAESLWEHGIYGRFFNTSQPIPTAYRPPLYPLLLTPLAGLGGMVHVAIAALHLALSMLTVWLVWRLALRWGLPVGASLVAAGLVAFDPILVNQCGLVMTETLATLLVVLALYALTPLLHSRSLLRAALAGVCLGLCALCRPTFFIWLGAVIVVLPLTAESLRRGLLQAAACLAGATLLLAPWAVRNNLCFGETILTTTHGGYTLLLGNNESFYQYLRTAGWGESFDARGFDERWSRQKWQAGASEIAWDEFAYELAWQNIRHDPAAFLRGCVMRVGWLWGLVPHQVQSPEGPQTRALRYATGVWYALEFLLAALGVAALGKQLFRAPWVWGLLLVLAVTAVHTVYWTNLRMRAPLMPVIALVACRGLPLLLPRASTVKPLAE